MIFVDLVMIVVWVFVLLVLMVGVYGVDVVFGFLVQYFFGVGWVGVVGCYVVGLLFGDLIVYFMVGGGGEGVYYFQYVVIVFGVQVGGDQVVVSGQGVQCGQMFFCQIYDVDVVVYFGVVWGVVVVVEYLQLFVFVYCYLCYIGYQVVGFIVGVFVDVVVFVGVYWVEIVQQCQ